MWYKSRFYTEMHGVMEILQLEIREHKMAQRRCVDVLGSLNECLCLSYAVYCHDKTPWSKSK